MTAKKWPVGDIRVRKIPRGSFYDIVFTGGGELPKELCSVYTNQTLAQKSIDDYIEARRVAYNLRKDIGKENKIPKQPKGGTYQMQSIEDL